jgi:dihydrofolate reductase
MVTLYNVISSDGFIARSDGSEDFIPNDIKLWQKFLGACLEHKTLIIGRRTYETIQEYDHSLIDSLEALPIQKIVVSGNKNFIPKAGYTSVSSPEEAVSLAPNALVSSGPTLNNYLLKHNLVEKIIQYKLSVSIGEGMKAFDENSLKITYLQ